MPVPLDTPAFPTAASPGAAAGPRDCVPTRPRERRVPGPTQIAHDRDHGNRIDSESIAGVHTTASGAVFRRIPGPPRADVATQGCFGFLFGEHAGNPEEAPN